MIDPITGQAYELAGPARVEHIHLPADPPERLVADQYYAVVRDTTMLRRQVELCRCPTAEFAAMIAAALNRDLENSR